MEVTRIISALKSPETEMDKAAVILPVVVIPPVEEIHLAVVTLRVQAETPMLSGASPAAQLLQPAPTKAEQR